MLEHVHVSASNARALRMVASALLALSGCLLLAATPARGELSASAYRVKAVCGQPGPGRASCMALTLVAKAPLAVPGARALGTASALPSSPPASTSTPAVVEQTKPISGSLFPASLLSAYDLPGQTAPSTPQTIAVVDAFDDATIEGDLQHYDQQYELPECTAANGCFAKVNQAAKPSPLPPSQGEAERSWAQEIATDVEISHAVCQTCRIVLVEAESERYEDLEAAEQAAVSMGASEISNSWGGVEPGFDSPVFNHPGIVITASAGDDGFRDWIAEPTFEFVSYPASSPHVIAVGGTRLLLNRPTDTRWLGEEVWNDGAEEEGFREEAGEGADGGGCSEGQFAPSWQRSLPDWTAVGCGEKRAESDISADADPFTGVAVYDSTENEGRKGWSVIGGTSVASPIIAAVFALAGGAHGVAYPAQSLYENAARDPAALHDVTSGSNGKCLKPLDFTSSPPRSSCSAAEEAAASCHGESICLAGPGYDGPTGLGTPDGIADFEASPQAAHETGRQESPASSQPAPSPPAIPSSPPPPILRAAPLVKQTVTLSGLELTFGALVALNRRHPHISQVGFAFDMDAPERVTATLAKRVRSHRRMRWQTLQRPLTFAGVAGHNGSRLKGRRILAAGSYRLTLTPSGGTARSLSFVIG